MPLEVSDAELLRRAIESRLGDVYTAGPGQIQAYDYLTRTADILPMTRRLVPIGDDEDTPEDLPVLPNVPVLFPGGSGFSVVWPLAVGDTVLVVHTTHAATQWRLTGEQSDPGDARLHALGNAVALALWPSDKSIASAAHPFVPEHMTVTVPAGKLLLLGSGTNPTDFVALAAKVSAELQALADAVMAAVAPSGGGPLTGFVYSPGDVAATKVKAE